MRIKQIRFFSLYFSKTCANISTENITKANAHYNAVVASFLMGRKDEAEKQYLLSLEAYPESVSTHLNYGNLLQETEHYKEAEEQYLFTLDIDPYYRRFSPENN